MVNTSRTGLGHKIVFAKNAESTAFPGIAAAPSVVSAIGVNCIQLKFQISHEVDSIHNVSPPLFKWIGVVTVYQLWKPPVLGTLTLASTLPLLSNTSKEALA